MKIGVMQPYFFPYIGYWQLLNTVDEYVIFDDVNYIKKGWINRNNILLNGKSKRINLHIKDASQNRLIKDTKLAQTDEDNKILLEVLKQSYHKAPYYEQVIYLVKEILDYKTDNLSEYLTNQIIQVCNYLDIRTKILLSSDIEKDNSLKGEEKIIEICKKRNADTYINAIGGKELYQHERFRKENMELKFLKTRNVNYKQFDNEFVPYLSIIDVMMFNEKEQIKELLDNYELEKN
jgi:hypothetical protein